jgi:hypothetical protein
MTDEAAKDPPARGGLFARFRRPAATEPAATEPAATEAAATEAATEPPPSHRHPTCRQSRRPAGCSGCAAGSAARRPS